MEHAAKTAIEASTVPAAALVAGGALNRGNCSVPNFTDMPLFFVEQYAFTVGDLFRSLAALATVISIAYFINKFMR